MKWLVVASFIVCLATLSKGNVIRDASESKDAASSKDNAQIDLIETSNNLRRVSTTSDAECLAGSEWESNCHRCRCSENGHAECSKLETCKGKYGDPATCKPHTSFKRDCNTCTCLENGLSLCTLQGCVHFTLPKIPVLKLDSGVACLPRSSWKSKCNHCTCTEDGYPTCTEMGCPGYENEPEKTCAPDTVWKNDCNTCSCSPDGRAMCTRMGCGILNVTNFNPVDDEDGDDASELNVSLNRRIRATSQVKTCQPGQEFRMDCNKCLCNDEGRDFSCTRNDCAALNSNGNPRPKRDVTTTQMETECEAGSVFYQGCNLCRCTEDGNHATCTLKRCNEEKKEDNVPESDPSFRCNPGEQSKRDCNDCSCSADGKSVFCTLRLCDQDITLTI